MNTILKPMSSSVRMIRKTVTAVHAVNLFGSGGGCGKRLASDWQLLAAVCLQRLPQIVPEMNWLEKKMDTVLKTIELNNSLLSDHEMRHFADIERAKRIASGDKVDEKDLDAAAKQTAQDFEEFYVKLYDQFTKSSRITQADMTSDRKSLDRCLDKHLMLVCKQRIGQTDQWLLPQAIHTDGETMRETAERGLKQFTGQQQQEIDVKFMGNSPSAVYSYRYPTDVTNRLQLKGAKIFIYKAIHLMGEFVPNDELCLDYEWLNRKELDQLLPEKYWKTIEKSLLIEELDINDIMSRNKSFSRIVKKRFSVSQ
ncbi:39S ribosomal protein L46, mitochondrial-like [Oppia nitens]|uniref:39S ribosomal protein L46, mitochondrial-like n=1 Tax=Oppia nitens TaxID=1686743 RepID=UPI0023DCDD46|nr:39S ribosomal protein L46, mitochondrial-like [Oppia nitens]